MPIHSRPLKEELLLAHFTAKETEVQRGGHFLSPALAAAVSRGMAMPGSEQVWVQQPLRATVTINSDIIHNAV